LKPTTNTRGTRGGFSIIDVDDGNTEKHDFDQVWASQMF
jgi:hypothetical protein